jgi:orotate phosphoribosyltransferase
MSPIAQVATRRELSRFAAACSDTFPCVAVNDPVSGSATAERLRRRAARALWAARAVRVDLAEPFELASGNRSPIYVNCRLLISDPAFMRLYTRAARAILAAAQVAVDAVAGGETAGIPYAAYLACRQRLPLLYVRKKAKGYGVASRVEGRLEPGWRVLLVEDLVTDGGSKLGFVEALRAAGATVEDALVLFDRQQGGAGVLAAHGVRLHAVTDLATALAAGGAVAGLSPAARAEIDRYLDDPAAWHAARGFAYR